MTCLPAMAAHLPAGRVAVADHLRGLGVGAARIKVHQRYFGFDEIRIASDTSLARQLVAATSGLVGLDRVRYVIQARTMPLATLYPSNPVAEVCAALGLPRATGFTVTQHSCASGLLAVHIAGTLLADDPDALALVLTGEKVFAAEADIISNTGVMGEGTAATLVRHGGGRNEVLGFATRTYGQFHVGARASAQLSAELVDIYVDALVDVMLGAVRDAGLTLADIAVVLPHHVGLSTWQRVIKELVVAPPVFLDNLPRIGHCHCADCFINYTDASRLGRIREGDHYLMTAVGLDATFSAMVLRH